MGRGRREPLGGSGQKEEVVGVTGAAAFKKPFYKHRVGAITLSAMMGGSERKRWKQNVLFHYSRHMLSHNG